jgi:outer membrane lipoprotein carrier protein
MFGHIWILIATSNPAAEAPTVAADLPAVVDEAPVIIEEEAAPRSFASFIANLPAAPDMIEAMPLPAVAAATDATAVVDKVQDFYKKTDRMSAKFRQTYTNKTFGEPTHSTGLVYIKKPGKMRWDYYKAKDVEKSFISDGKMLWAVDHDNKQVFKRDLQKNLLPVAISFLYGEGDLKRDFVAAIDDSGTYGSKGDVVLRLTPKKPSAQYKTLFLVVDPKDHQVKQSIVVESSGNTNHFRFIDSDLSRNVKDTWFYFNDKASNVKNYRIIDGDKEGQ